MPIIRKPQLKIIFRRVSLLASFIALVSCGEHITKNELSPILSVGLTLSEETSIMANFIDERGSHAGQALVVHSPNGVLFRVGVKRLSKGWHGIHLHQKADCSDGSNGFKASGGHIDPEDNDHGLLSIVGYEVADMPNIYAGSDGWGHAAFFNPELRLFPSEENAATAAAILLDDDGFAIIIHENPDDHLTQPIGGAGARVACAAFTQVRPN